MPRVAAAILISLSAAGHALAADSFEGAPRLALPIDCTLPDTCYIQNYVDTDPGQGVADYRCTAQSYDGHKGTDFALPSRAEMARGVDVLAAAPGRVLRARDGMDDGTFLTDPARIEGRECGNGLVIDHGDGWESQYCHLAKGSITVQRGDEVAAGTPLGKVGLSGRTEFPHLHFSVRHDGRVIDPFDPEDRAGTCRGGPAPTVGAAEKIALPDGGTLTIARPETAAQAAAPTLWADPPAYAPAGFLRVALSAAEPDFDAIQQGSERGAQTLPRNAAMLILWVYGHHARPGDTLEFALDGPEGLTFRGSTAFTRDTALFHRNFAKRFTGLWPAGRYLGTVTLLREGASVATGAAQVVIGG